MISAKIILDLSKRNGTSHTELMNNVIEETGKSERLVKSRIKEAEEKGYIAKKKVPTRGYPLYFNTTVRRTEQFGNKMYLRGKKKKTFFSQEDIDNLISVNEKRFDGVILKGPKNIYSEASELLLSCLYWHNKLTFAIESGWLGFSEADYVLAKANKNRFEKLMKKIMRIAWKTDKEMYHTLLHAVYDVIDANRILTEEQIRMVWS